LNTGLLGKAGLAVIVSAVGALVTALGPGNQNLGDLSLQTWLVAIGSVLSSGALVYIVDNIVGIAGGVAKAILAFLSSGFASLVAALDDGIITQGEWLTAFGAAVVATGFVYQAPALVRRTRL
jgi:hypothetical protein